MSRGGFFLNLDSGAYFLSLGFRGWLALGVPVGSASLDGETFLFADVAGVAVQALRGHGAGLESVWRGVVVELLSPLDVPGPLRCRGVVWRELQLMEPAPFALTHKARLRRTDAEALCRAAGVRVPRPDRGAPGLADLVRALVQHYFPDESDATQGAYVDGVVAPVADGPVAQILWFR